MATTHAVAAKYVHNRVALAALATIFAASLAGCSTSNNLLGTGSSIGPGSSKTAANKAIKPTQVARQIAIPDIIGAPEAVNRQLVQQLSTSVQGQNLVVAKSGTLKPDYTLRGYMVAAKERKGTKISYIWDLTDKAGTKLKRITGEELAPKTAAKDPWSAVTPPLIQKISSKAATSIATAIPRTPSPAPIGAVASNAKLPASATTTGSIGNTASRVAFVRPVTGAPGDGNIALTRAMKKALVGNGILVDPRNPKTAYRVEGKVKLIGRPKGKNQAVQLLWTVKDAAGRNVGGLQQDNAIDLATLNGKWGAMADDAAGAAAQGIAKLLPQKVVRAPN